MKVLLTKKKREMKKEKFLKKTKCPFVLRFTDEICDLKEKRPRHESHKGQSQGEGIYLVFLSGMTQ